MLATIRCPISLSFANPAAAGVAASLDPMELGFASGLASLSRFRALMQEDGQTVDTQRMLSDSHYAITSLRNWPWPTPARMRICACVRCRCLRCTSVKFCRSCLGGVR